MNSEIMEFNKKLVDENIDIDIIDYIVEIVDQFFKIDINFIHDFMDLVNKDECCIPQEYLVKYGVLKNIESSSTIKTLIDQCDLILPGAKPLYTYIQRDDSSHKKEYFLHPLLCKYSLIRSKNTSIYSQYYLLLEECIKHFSEYQILKLQKKHTRK